MTDITDEQVAEWAKEASKHALIKWFAKAAKESPGFFRRFAELARQDEREACAWIAETAADLLQNSTFDGVAQAIRARGSDK